MARSNYCNFFGVAVQKDPFGRPQKYKVQSAGALVAIQSAVTKAQGTISDCLNKADSSKGKRLFKGSGLPLLSTFGGGDGVLGLFNSALSSSARPGTVFLTAQHLFNLLPSTLFDGNLLSDDLPTDLKDFIGFFDIGLGVLQGRGLSRVESPHLNLIHYLSKFDWSGQDSDWDDNYQDELFRYYVDLFAGKFVDRNGGVLKFDLRLSDLQLQNLQALPQTIAASSPSIAQALISILVEYLCDEAFQVPFYSATGPVPPPASYPFTCYRAGVVTEILSDITTKDNPKVDESALVGKIIASASSAAQKELQSIVGGLIRGGGIAAINNEVIAEVISSILSTLAKKYVEKATYETLKEFINNVFDNDPVLKALKDIYADT